MRYSTSAVAVSTPVNGLRLSGSAVQPMRRVLVAAAGDADPAAGGAASSPPATSAGAPAATVMASARAHSARIPQTNDLFPRVRLM